MAGDRICEGDGKGLFFPILPKENTWHKPARAFMYFVALLWCFLGVSIVADIFMGAIEAVTSRRRAKRLPGGRTVYVKIWNPTVANLTLMALGSSAPEILLSVIEVLANNMFSGELGPSTIVGSAAFNLMVIIAVCVYVIPEGKKRTIKQPVVFGITAVFSVFAYLWLLLILAIISPDIVEWWEGVLTFLFFPILVLLAWLADVGLIGPATHKAQGQEQRELVMKKLLDSGISASATEVGKLARDAAHAEIAAKSRAQHRLEVTMGTRANGPAKPLSEEELSVGFLSSMYVFAENDCIALEVEKTGRLARDSGVVLDYCIFSQAHQLIGREKMEVLAGELTGKARVMLSADNIQAFPEQSKDRCVWLEIVSATFLKESSAMIACSTLFDEESPGAGDQRRKHHNGKVCVSEDRRRAQAFIKDAKNMPTGAGQLRFEKAEVMHEASSTENTVAKVKVQRFNGHRGQLTCGYRTEADTARPIYDFDHVEDVLTFPDGAMEMIIEVVIAPKGKWEGRDRFYVQLFDDAAEEAEQPMLVEGGSTCSVTIDETGQPTSAHARLLRGLDAALNIDAIQQGNAEWSEQLVAAFRPVSGDDDDAEVASVGAWALHFVALPWKLFFALIPPSTYGGGWVCFGVSLIFIGVVTAVIGDLASLMGCCLGLPDSITAITIVALGTSLPDLFASKVAAVEDPSADNAIGNVTGSNSVNVFLGLGLPWAIAGVFWHLQGKTPEWLERNAELVASGKLGAEAFAKGGFVVPAGDLSFSVAVFTVCSLATLATIIYRRKRFQAELGGPSGVKVNTAIFFVLLWLMYIGLASWRTLVSSASIAEQVGAVFAAILCLLFGMAVTAGIVHVTAHFSAARKAESKSQMAKLVQAVQQVATANAVARHASAGFSSAMCRKGTSSMPPPRPPPPPPPLPAGDLATAVASMKEHLASLQAVCDSLERQARAGGGGAERPGPQEPAQPPPPRKASKELAAPPPLEVVPEHQEGAEAPADPQKPAKTTRRTKASRMGADALVPSKQATTSRASQQSVAERPRPSSE